MLKCNLKVYPEGGKALTSYFPSWLNLLWKKKSSMEKHLFIKNKDSPLSYNY